MRIIIQLGVQQVKIDDDCILGSVNISRPHGSGRGVDD